MQTGRQTIRKKKQRDRHIGTGQAERQKYRQVGRTSNGSTEIQAEIQTRRHRHEIHTYTHTYRQGDRHTKHADKNTDREPEI